MLGEFAERLVFPCMAVLLNVRLDVEFLPSSDGPVNRDEFHHGYPDGGLKCAILA